MRRHWVPQISETYFEAAKDHTLWNMTVNLVELNDTNAVLNVSIAFFGKEEAANGCRFNSP